MPTMHPTKATRIIKNLFAGYTEPPALSNQHSQKLLDGLKSSFRNKLDQEYGHASDSPSSSHPSQAFSSQKRKDSDRPDVVRHSAANQHLKNLLSNPLFSYQNQTTKTIQTSPISSQTSKRDPMDVFDHAVSKGMMTFKAATGIMVAKRQQLRSASESSTILPDSGTARRIVRWVRSSRPESDLEFLDNQAFMKELMPFLVAESLEHVAWEWIARTLNPSLKVPSAAQQHRRASFLLEELVRLKTQPQHQDLDAAIMTLVQARQSLKGNTLLPQLLFQPWRSVSWLSTVESYSHKTPSAMVYNAHVETAESLNTPVDVENAHLRLLHPTRPDYAPALRLFQDREKLRGLVQGITSWKFASRKHKGPAPWLVVLANDTINYLAQSGRNEEAEEVARLFQSELGSDHNLAR